MKKLLMVVMMLVALVLAGCVHDISEGTAVDKSKTEASSYIMPIQSGKSTIYVPHYVPAYYYLHVEGVDKNGKAVVEKFSVSKDSYEKYQVGDHFIYQEK